MYLCDCFFYFNETAPTQIYTLSLHDALPISLPHEVVREVGGGREVLPRGAPHAIGAERERGEERRQDADDRLERVHGVEERLLVLLHVGVVRERQALHRRQHGDEVAVEAAALATDQLRDVGGLLLGHDRRARRERVRELDEAELGGRPERGGRREPRGGDAPGRAA